MNGEVSIDLGESVDGAAKRLLDWPDLFVTQLRDRLLAIHGKRPLEEEERRELLERGVLERLDGKLSSYGEKLRELMVLEAYQDGDEVGEFLQEGRVQLEGAVLEVGCSTGRVLRHLTTPLPRRRVGLDVNATALALGSRLAAMEKQEIHFCCGSMHAIPFEAEGFDWVICRNALTYTHQRTSLREMARVLRPGGWLFLRFENIHFDFGWLKLTRPAVMFSRLRNLGVGLVHQATGWQPVPGNAWIGCRAYASAGQVSRWLREFGCEIVRVAPSRCCPTFFGRANQTSMLVRKRGSWSVVLGS